MDQSPLVNDRVYAGRRLAERFAADGHPLRAAFWAKTADEGHWFLYLVTDDVDTAGPLAVYRAVHATLQKLQPTGLTGAEVKVVRPADAAARDVAALLANRPGRVAVFLEDEVLGGTAVEQLYVYPTHVFTCGPGAAMTTEDVGREIVRLMTRGPGVLHLSRVTLKDGTHFNGVPFGIQLGGQTAVVAQFIADGEAAPRVVRLDEIASIA